MIIFHKKKLKNCLLSWLILILFLISPGIKANIGPPYPEVWGYDLSSYPALQTRGGSIDAYRLADNDIGFLILIDYKIDSSLSEKDIFESHQYMLLHFFTGEREYLAHEKWKNFVDTMRDKEISYKNYGVVVNFKDGSNVERIINSPPKRCLMPEYLQSELVKKNDTQEQHYFILSKYNTIYVQQDKASCNILSAPFFYTSLYNLAERIIDLGDDSFIVYSSTGNLLLRLDKNVQTRFNPVSNFKAYNNKIINRNFFIINSEEFESLNDYAFDDEKLPYYQTINDQLLILLYKKYPLTS